MYFHRGYPVTGLFFTISVSVDYNKQKSLYFPTKWPTMQRFFAIFRLLKNQFCLHLILPNLQSQNSYLGVGSIIHFSFIPIDENCSQPFRIFTAFRGLHPFSPIIACYFAIFRLLKDQFCLHLILPNLQSQNSYLGVGSIIHFSFMPIDENCSQPFRMFTVFRALHPFSPIIACYFASI